MKRLMFYCQHILGIGHLVRSLEIVRGLIDDFQICFVNGGEVIEGFAIPQGIELINLPGIKTDAEFRSLQTVDPTQDLAEVQETRKQQLLQILDRFQPDILMIELFPFGRRKFSFELIPLLDRIQASGRNTKVVCSLRDIVVTKQNREKHEDKVCTLMNRYFDLLLIHGDPQFQQIEETFSRIHDLNCATHYTGYVVQPQPTPGEMAHPDMPQPMILVSIGGGRFGHELLDGVIAAAPILEQQIPHQIQMFTGPFFPEEKFAALTAKVAHCSNVRIDRFTPNLLTYMSKADLSISMSGYNTTMNILTTGVRALLLAFTGNDDQEQRLRSQKLADMGIVNVLQPSELAGDLLAEKVIACLQKQPSKIQFDFAGVEKTASLLRQLVIEQQAA
jgi:predicted glycosyltransferase